MTQTYPSNDAAIREQAYLLWEREGRPAGRDMEFWTRAQVALAENEQLQHLTKPAPKRAKSQRQEVAASPAEAASTGSSKAKPAKADGKDKPKKK